LKAGDSSPISSIRSSTVIGDRGISAILGFEHNLLQSLSYDVDLGKPAIIARAYISPPQLSPDHLAEQFLVLSQNRDDKTNLGWGLRVEPVGCRILQVERGFIDSQQPTRIRYAGIEKAQNDRTISTATAYVEKLASYVKDGQLFQAMIVASTEPGLAMTWKLGGKFQLLAGQPAKPSPVVDERSFTYSTKTSYEDKVLTLTGKMTETVREKADGEEAGGEGNIRVETNIVLT